MPASACCETSNSMGYRLLTITALIAVLLNDILASAETYYITPSNSRCPEDKDSINVTCSTLSQFANMTSNSFDSSNVSLVFLPGNHSLETKIEFMNLSYVSLQALSEDSTSLITIICNESAMFAFNNIDYVIVRAIAFYGCVGNVVVSVKQFELENCVLNGLSRNGTMQEVNQAILSSIKKCSYISFGRSGGGLSAYCSTAMVSGSTFSNNIVNSETGRTSFETGGGALYGQYCNITISSSIFTNNSAKGIYGADGGALYAYGTDVTVSGSTFANNNVIATYLVRGGAIYTFGLQASIKIDNCMFMNNTAISMENNVEGGAMSCTAGFNMVDIKSSSFTNNALYSKLDGRGGAVSISASPIIISNCTFSNNTVIASYGFGGVLYVNRRGFDIVLYSNIFAGNTLNATTESGYGYGGAIYIQGGQTNSYLPDNIVTLKDNTFSNTTVVGNEKSRGGALLVTTCNITLTGYNIFTANYLVSGRGGGISVESSNLTSNGKLEIDDNMADYGAAIFAVDSKSHFSGTTIISRNNWWKLPQLVKNESSRQNTFASQQSEGGGITLYRSETTFVGNVTLIYNAAKHGGAILLFQSKLYTFGITIIAYNLANSGGGVHAYKSELNFKGYTIVAKNTATGKGGGIYSVVTTTKLVGSRSGRQNGFLNFFANHANKGGAIYLEANSNLYVDKKQFESNNIFLKRYTPILVLNFTNNFAHYGGALYIADETISSACLTALSEYDAEVGECFLQVLRVPIPSGSETAFGNGPNSLNLQNIFFINNTASIAAGQIFGGLLDRCQVSVFAEAYYKYNQTSNSLRVSSYLTDITNIQQQDFSSVMSSDPVRVCFCKNNLPDCNFQPPHIYVQKGETFKVSLVAVDQVNNTLPNTNIHASLSSGATLGEGGQYLQVTNQSCSDLTYNVLSSNNAERLRLYAEGPCTDIGISSAYITINIARCPIGFADNGLHCYCDPILTNYVSNCSIDTESVVRRDNAWFAFVNNTDQYKFVFYEYCPFDYCYSSTQQISVNLNIPNDANALCAFNRSGKLCGSCEESLSLTLGSSHCTECSNNWLVLLIVFAIAGVALVAFIFVFNLTVTVGSINGLIFYANVIAANRAIFLPFNRPNFFTIFIAWLNLDFGFETCFYNGMDGYAKTWLQFLFPLYILFLVVLVIVIAQYSFKFAKLLHQGNRNPIAVLATLVLLSTSKFVQIIITTLSFATLNHSDGTKEIVWLIDANLPYLQGKRIPLFLASLVVVILGTAYMVLLIFWQWLMRSPKKWKPMKWTANPYLIAFMEVYHAPFNSKHRYWIGLLLLVRVIFYLVAAVNVLGDPKINLHGIIITMIGLFTFQYKAVTLTKNPLYKDNIIDTFENIFLLNLSGITFVTICLLEDNKSPAMVASVSTAVSFITFLAILVYHIVMFSPLKPLLQKCVIKIQSIPETQEEEGDTNQQESILNRNLYEVSETEVDCRHLKCYDSIEVRSLPAQPSKDKTKHAYENIHTLSYQKL